MQMGVIKFTPEMNENNHSTDPSVASRRSLSLTGENAPMYDVLGQIETETLKHKMKLKLEGSSAVSPPAGFVKSDESLHKGSDAVVNGHELSLSLPNLNDSDEGSLRGGHHHVTTNEKNARSSLSNIYDGKLSPGSVIMCSPNSSVNSTSCLLSKSPELLQQQQHSPGSTETSPQERQTLLGHSRQCSNCSDVSPVRFLGQSNENPAVPSREDDSLHSNNTVSVQQQQQQQQQQSPAKSPSNRGDITITMEGSANRLSAVLENIPLFYLPQTKQLISLSPEHHPKVSNSADSNSLDTDNCSCGGPGPEEGASVVETYSNPYPARNHNHHHYNCTEEEECSNPSETPADSENGRKAHQMALPEAIGGESGALASGGNVSQSRIRRLSSEDSENSTLALSQDSSDSLRTIRGLNSSLHSHHYQQQLYAEQQQQLSQGNNNSNSSKTDNRSLKSCDFDEISLSRVSLDHDSPKNSLHRASTLGSLPLGEDDASYSSISSMSTGTDFTSYTDDYIEIRAPNAAAGKSSNDSSTNARNSYERSRNSSLDSGIADERLVHQGAKPKRRGLTGFFTR